MAARTNRNVERGKSRHRRTKRAADTQATSPTFRSDRSAVAAVTSAGYATYIGRVGALAVALGVGMAVATGYGTGIAWAQDDTDTNENSAADAPPDTPAAGAGDPGAEQTSADGSDDPDPDGEDGDDDSGMNVESSGGQDSSTNDEGQSTDDNDDNNEADDGEVDGGPAQIAAPETTPDPQSAPPAPPNPPAAPENTPVPQGQAQQSISPTSPPAGRIATGNTPLADEPTAGTTATSSISTLSTGMPVQGRMSFAPPNSAHGPQLTTAGGNESASATLADTSLTQTENAVMGLPGTVLSVVTTLVSAFLSPFLSTGPSVPAEPPLLWVVLGFVRREISRTFFNGTPNAVADPVTTSEETPKIIDALANDTDEDALSITGFTQPTNGTVTLTDGKFTYTPKPNFQGTDTFSYTVSDAESPLHLHGFFGFFGGGHTDTATVSINVIPANDAPTAKPDGPFNVNEDGSVTLTAAQLVGNDTDPDVGDTLKVASVVAGANGGVVLNENGSVTFTPTAGYSGAASFTYRVSDAANVVSTNAATVTINVVGVNDAPTANPDGPFDVAEDGSVTLTAARLVGNDTDPDAGDTLKVASVVAGANGGVVLNDNGTVTFTPTPGYSGAATFTYRVSDAANVVSTDAATVSMNVTAAPDTSPVINEASRGEPNEDGSFSGSFRVTDPDIENVTITIADADRPDYGVVQFTVTEVNATTRVVNYTYTPTQAGAIRAGLTAVDEVDSFAFTVDDGVTTPVTQVIGGIAVAPAYLAAASQPIRVELGPARVAVGDDGRVYVFNSNSSSVTVVNTDGSTDQVEVEGFSPSGGGRIIASPDGKIYVASGSIVNPGHLNVINADNSTTAIPVGVYPTGVATNSDGTRVYVANAFSNSITVIDTVSGESSTISNVPVPGALAVSPDNARIYVINDNAQGGGHGLTVINAANTDDRITIDVGDVGLTSDIVLSPDGGRLYLTNISSDSTPATTVTVVDTATGDIETIEVGDFPTGLALSPDGSALWVASHAVADNGFDLDSKISVIDTATNQIVDTLPAAGLAFDTAVSPNGTRIYVPNFTGGAVSTFSIVPGENVAAPEATANVDDENVDQTTGAVTVTVTASDPDGNPMWVRSDDLTRGELEIVDNGGGTFTLTYTPTDEARHAAAAANATDADKYNTFTVIISDGKLFDAVTVTVPVDPENTGFTAVADVESGFGPDGEVVGHIVVTDPDDTTHFFSGSGPTPDGEVVVSEDGSFTYTPRPDARHAAAADNAPDAATTDSFTITVSDGHGETKTVTVTVDIDPANEEAEDGDVTTDPGFGPLGEVTGSVTVLDPDGDSVTYTGETIVTTKGTAVVAEDGTWTYTPTPEARHNAAADNADFAKFDNFLVTAIDGHGGTTDVFVSVTVSESNVDPTDGVVEIDSVLGPNGETSGRVTVTDPDDPTHKFTGSTSNIKGSVVVNQTTGTFTYTPTEAARHKASLDTATDADKTFSFTVTVDDRHGGTISVPVTVDIDPYNTDPSATAAPSVGSPGHLGAVTGSLNVVDDENDTLDYDVGIAPTKGDVVFHANGTYTYTPHPPERLTAYTGGEDVYDTFTVEVTDGHGGTVTVTVDQVAVDPAAAVLLSSVTEPGLPQGGVVVGPNGTVYQMIENGLIVLDKDDPESFTTISLAGQPELIAVGKDDIAYVTVYTPDNTYEYTVVRIDPNDLQNPITYDEFPGTSVWPAQIGPDGTAYLTRTFISSGGQLTTKVFVISPDDPNNPTTITVDGDHGFAFGTVQLGADGTAYQLVDDTTTSRLIVIDPENPGNPTIIDVQTVPTSSALTLSDDGTAYFAYQTGSGGTAVTHVLVIDPDDAANYATVPVTGTLDDLVIRTDGTAYQTTRTQTTTRVLVIDPLNPASSTITEITGVTRGILLGPDDRAYLSLSRTQSGVTYTRVAVIDPGDVNNPNEVEFIGNADDWAVTDDGVVHHVITNHNGSGAGNYTLAVIDSADLQNPEFVDLPGNPARLLAGHDGTGYVVYGDESINPDGRVLVVNVDDPQNYTVVEFPGSVRDTLLGPDGALYVTSWTLTPQGGGSYSIDAVHLTLVHPDIPNSGVTHDIGFPSGYPGTGVMFDENGRAYLSHRPPSDLDGLILILEPNDPGNPIRVATDVFAVGDSPAGSFAFGPDGTIYQTVRHMTFVGSDIGWTTTVYVIGVADSPSTV